VYVQVVMPQVHHHTCVHLKQVHGNMVQQLHGLTPLQPLLIPLTKNSPLIKVALAKHQHHGLLMVAMYYTFVSLLLMHIHYNYKIQPVPLLPQVVVMLSHLLIQPLMVLLLVISFTPFLPTLHLPLSCK
jgi:hypothetical protein